MGPKSDTNEGDTILFFVPSPNEQAKIACFLDWKTTQINKFIHNKRRLIELLREQKQNVINQAVTRGLDPTNSPGADLNANRQGGGPKGKGMDSPSSVKLKPSGVEWIGDIPEHWEARWLRTLAAVRASGVDKNTNEDEVPICSVTMWTFTGTTASPLPLIS